MPSLPPYKVGLTCGIGSGKTTVARIFGVLGIPVYFADDAGKRLMNEHAGLKAQITGLFGTAAYANGTLDRGLLARRAFAEPAVLAQLNAFVHPVTLEDARNWMSRQNSPYVVKEAAILFEAGGNKDLDFVIGVSAPEAIRIARVMARDGKSEEEIRQRIDRQWPDEKKMALCDAVLVNDDRQALLPQVLALHGNLLRHAK